MSRTWVDVYAGQITHDPEYLGSVALPTTDSRAHVVRQLDTLGVLRPHPGIPATYDGWLAWWYRLADSGSHGWLAEAGGELARSWPHEHATSVDTPWAVTYASGSVHVYRRGRLYLTAHVNRAGLEGGGAPTAFPPIEGAPRG